MNTLDSSLSFPVTPTPFLSCNSCPSSPLLHFLHSISAPPLSLSLLPSCCPLFLPLHCPPMPVPALFLLPHRYTPLCPFLNLQPLFLHLSSVPFSLSLSVIQSAAHSFLTSPIKDTACKYSALCCFHRQGHRRNPNSKAL